MTKVAIHTVEYIISVHVTAQRQVKRRRQYAQRSEKINFCTRAKKRDTSEETEDSAPLFQCF